jgi:hypothetical protein
VLVPLPLPNAMRRKTGGVGQGDHAIYLLADEEHIHGAEVEVVKKRQRSQPVVGRMLAGIKLLRGA